MKSVYKPPATIILLQIDTDEEFFLKKCTLYQIISIYQLRWWDLNSTIDLFPRTL